MTYRVTDDGVDEWRNGKWFRIAPTQTDATALLAVANAEAIAQANSEIDVNTHNLVVANKANAANSAAINQTNIVVGQHGVAIQQNASDIAANSVAIQQNASDIAAQAAQLATQAAQLATVAAGLAQAQVDIDDNADALVLVNQEVDQLAITVNQLTTSLAGKLDKTGGTLTGNLTISKTFPLLELKGKATAKWWAYHDTGDETFKLSFNESPQFQVSQTGSVWTKELGDLRTYILAQAGEGVGSKVSKTGDTMTGDLKIEKTYAALRMVYPGVREWFWQVRENGYMYAWDQSANTARFAIGHDGSLWCSQLGDINNRIETRARDWANDRVANLNTRWVSRGQLNAYQGNTWWEAPSGAALTGGYTPSQYQITYFYYRYFQLFDPARGWITAHYA